MTTAVSGTIWTSAGTTERRSDRRASAESYPQHMWASLLISMLNSRYAVDPLGFFLFAAGKYRLLSTGAEQPLHRPAHLRDLHWRTAELPPLARTVAQQIEAVAVQAEQPDAGG